LQQNINALRALGFAKADLDARNYVDLTIVQEAARRMQ